MGDRAEQGAGEPEDALGQGGSVRGADLLCLHVDVSIDTLLRTTSTATHPRPIILEHHADMYGHCRRLIFMTYNGWVMVAVTLGAFLGYLVFGAHTPVNKETQCH